MNTQVACLNLVLATAVFQTEYIIHDALLAVGHKPDETDGLILRIGAQVDDETVKSLKRAPAQDALLVSAERIGVAGRMPDAD